MILEKGQATELMAWLLVDPLSLESAVSLAVGRVPLFGRPHPPTFTPLLLAAESALEDGSMRAANGWRSIKSRRHNGGDHIEPSVKQAEFRAWLEGTLPPQLQDDAFFFLAPPDAWPPAPNGADPVATKRPKKIRSDREQSLLRVIAAMWDLSTLPREPHVAADKIAGIISAWGWDGPVTGTIAEIILVEAANLPGADIRKSDGSARNSDRKRS